MKSRILRIDLRGYWHAGGGRGAGAVLDAVVHRDSDGLPVLPGRHIKGLLREAVARAEDWSWKGYEKGITAKLFGSRTEAGDKGGQSNQGDKENLPASGCLRVSDGRLPDPVAAWLVGEDKRKYRSALFRELYATAVDADTGTALDRSLRGIEVTVPLELFARIDVISDNELPDSWPDVIAGALPLIDAVGACRSRGLGRAVLTLEEDGA